MSTRRHDPFDAPGGVGIRGAFQGGAHRTTVTDRDRTDKRGSRVDGRGAAASGLPVRRAAVGLIPAEVGRDRGGERSAPAGQGPAEFDGMGVPDEGGATVGGGDAKTFAFAE